MRCSLIRVALGIVAAGLAVLARAAQPPAGFTALFNGKDLTGWRGGDTFDHRVLLAMAPAERTAKIAEWTKSLTEPGKDGKPHWRAENGVLENDGSGRYATTEKDYGDFELMLEYKIEKGADSGVYLRGAPQVQIWDTAIPDTKDIGYAKGSGGLWNNAKGSPGQEPLVKADNPIGQWNHLRVVMVGSRVSVWLNKKLVVDHAILENTYYNKANKVKPENWLPIPPRGPIELQTHGGATSWRNIYLREISGDEANKILASKGGQGYKKIFNGKNLDGWAGPLEAVNVQDGALVWQEKKGGTIYWNHELSDFNARVMFKVPKAGNNGLAIRYPGTGDVAYAGMCELQILDDNYEINKPAHIEPQQAHGSAYGMVAAARGYQHPLGEWNFEEVTIKGSMIKVELNGTVILDTDLSKATINEKVLKKPQIGRDRKSGFFGFAGHNDPVQFKDVEIREL